MYIAKPERQTDTWVDGIRERERERERERGIPLPQTTFTSKPLLTIRLSLTLLQQTVRGHADNPTT